MSERGEYRSIRTVIVDGPDFKQLHPNTKLVWVYIKLQLGPLGLGVFNSAKHVLSEQTGLKPRQVDAALKELDGEPNWFRREDNIFWIVGGLKNDPAFRVSNSNHRMSVRQLTGALPRLRIVDEFRDAHPEWFIDAMPGQDNPPSNGIAHTIPPANGDTIGDAIPHATGIKGRGNTKTEDKDEDEDEDEEESESASPRIALPAEATAFLAQFYEPAFTDRARDRYRNVKQQLYEVLDPKHPGPKIRGGIRVKARSPQHLADELKATMKDPPPDRDLAIVWVLKKLTNPPKGPSVTEETARREKEQRDLEERYQREAKQAGTRWANDHLDEYGKICASVNANLPASGGEWTKAAREAQLSQRLAKAAGFPDFETWLERQQVPA